jgi:hypothetical protein
VKKARAQKKINVIRASDKPAKLKEAPLKLHLACGDRPREGYVNVDIVKTEAADMTWDLTKRPWPWRSGSVSEIVAQHFFEHLTPSERIGFMEECYRVLGDDGIVELVTPYWSSIRAIQDPTHVWPPLCEASFLYFSKRWLEANKLLHAHPYKANFEFIGGQGHNAEFVSKPAEVRQFAGNHYINAVDDLYVKLIKVNGLDPANDAVANACVAKLQGQK